MILKQVTKSYLSRIIKNENGCHYGRQSHVIAQNVAIRRHAILVSPCKKYEN